MDNFFKYIFGTIILSAIGLTFFIFFYIVYTKFTDEYTVIYKGQVKITNTFHEPAHTIIGFRGSTYIPERNGLKLQSNILNADLETSYTEMSKYRYMMQDGKQHHVDVIIVLRETILPNSTFEKEVQMFFVKDNSKYKVGDHYKPSKKDNLL